jgi:MFS family permease
VGGLLLAGVGTASYLLVHSSGSAILVSAVQGAGFAATWFGVFPLLIRSVGPERRGDVLGANYAATNLGLGLASGELRSNDRPQRMTV